MHVMPQRMSHTDQRVFETGCLALGVAVVLTAIGTYAGTGTEGGDSIASYLGLVAVLAAITVGVYALAVRRAESHEDAASRTRAALILGACSVLSIAVFWTGLPTVLAAGAVLLGYDARRAGGAGAMPYVAAGLGCLAFVAAIVLAWTG
jgi:hypothetical protein